MFPIINQLKKSLNQKGVKVKSLYCYCDGLLSPESSKIRKLIDPRQKNEYRTGDYFIVPVGKEYILIFETDAKNLIGLKKWLKRVKIHLFQTLQVCHSNYYHTGVLKIIKRITLTKTTEEIFGDILKALCELIKIDIASVNIYDRATNMTIAMGPGYNVTPDEIKFFRFELVEKSSAFVALTRKKTYCTNNAPQDPYILQKFVQHYRCDKVCCVPLFVLGEIFGFIYLVRRKHLHPFTKGEIEILDDIAGQIGWLLKMLKTTDDLHRRANALLNLESAGRAIVSALDLREILDLIVRICNELLHADGASLMALDVERDGYVIRAAVGVSKNYMAKQFLPRDKYDSFVKASGTAPQLLKDPDKLGIRDLNLIKGEGILSILSLPLMHGDKITGILNVYSKKPRIFSPEDFEILRLFALEAVIAIRNAELYQNMVLNTESMIETLSQLESEKDTYTSEHSEQVATFAVEIAKRLKLSESVLKIVHYAGLLHDVGKIIIDQTLLRKKEPLTEQEWYEIKKHPVVGKNIIEKIRGISNVHEYVHHHHERYDGTGYPDQLAGENISLGARILSIADSVEAMLSERPYRKAMSVLEVIEELKREKGKQFDPKLVDITIKILTTKKKFDSGNN